VGSFVDLTVHRFEILDAVSFDVLDPLQCDFATVSGQVGGVRDDVHSVRADVENVNGDYAARIEAARSHAIPYPLLCPHDLLVLGNGYAWVAPDPVVVAALDKGEEHYGK
jgi:hypothetical protein